MASEIRVNKLNSQTGVGTITLSPTGVDISGITTAATLRATTGIVTSLTAGSLTSLGAVSGTTGTFTGDVSIPDTIVHTGATDTKIRFPSADTFSVETAGGERLRVASNGKITHTAASGSTILTLKRSNENTSGATGTINFAASDDHSVASIIAIGDGDNEGAHLSFRTTTAASSDDPYDSSIIERLSIASDGDVEVKTGNLVIGTSGKGIDFSATGGPNSGSTGTSELLDDYEEGDYIPSFTVQSGTVTIDSSINTLTYTKIGRQVTIIGQIKVSSVSGPSGIFRASLPFTRSDQTEQGDRTMGNIVVTNAAVNNANEFSNYPDGGGDSYLEIVSISGTSVTRNGGQNMQSNTYIYVNYTYFAS